MAVEGGLIDLVTAVLAVSHGEVLVDTGIHIHVKDPVSDVVSLINADQILLGKRNLSRRWDVCVLEVRVIIDTAAIRVFNGLIEIKVAIEEHKSHVVDSLSAVSFASIHKSLVCSDLLCISQKRGAKLGQDSSQTTSGTLTLEEQEVGNEQILVELLVNRVLLIYLKGKILAEFLQHLLQDLEFHLMDGSQYFNSNCLVNWKHFLKDGATVSGDNSSCLFILSLLKEHS